MATIKALINGEYVDLPPYATAFYGGEYPDLNFSVVGGITQPTAPTENMIWVNTDTAITDWIFSAIQPITKSDGTPLSGGEVWFNVSMSSSAQFNALRRNGLWVYPTACKQYVSGAWVAKVAKIYKSSAWKDWNLIVFDGTWHNGYEFKALTNSIQSGTSTITNNANPVTVSVKNGQGAYIEKIDVTNYKTLKVTCSLAFAGLVEWMIMGLSTDTKIYDAATTNMVVSSENRANFTKTTKTFDISSLSGSYYFKMYAYSSGGVTFSLYELTLEA